MLDGLGVAIGFAVSLAMIGFARELFGTGTIQLGQVLPLGFEYTLFSGLGLEKYAYSVLVQPPGAFLVIGFLLAIITAFRQSKTTKGAKK